MADISFINGKFTSNATTDIEDRGYLFGDGIYEVLRTYNKKIFCLKEHMERLNRSAREIRLELERLPWDIQESILEANEKSGFENGKIYIQVTRGTAPRNHIFPDTTPTLVITIKKIEPLPSRVYNDGVMIITLPDNRWKRCDIKSLNLLPNVLAKQSAVEAGAFEAVFYRDGLITEASTSNIFIIKNNIISTPQADNKILHGITRKTLMELCRELSLGKGSRISGEVVEKEITTNELLDADEIFLTGTTIELVPVVKIDDKRISDAPGEIFSLLREKWKTYRKT